MGNSHSLDDADQISAQQILQMNQISQIQTGKKLKASCRNLQNFTLSDIRKMYDHFRRLSSLPFIDVTTFCHIVPFNRVTAIFLFKEIKDLMNFYEFLCILILTSYANTDYKIRLIFLIFDFDSSNTIDILEMTIICLCFIRGFCSVTDQPIPSKIQTEVMAQYIFTKQYVKLDNALYFKDFKDWIQNNIMSMQIFSAYDVERRVSIGLSSLRPIQNFETEEAKNIFKLINASFKQQKFQQTYEDALIKMGERKSICQVQPINSNINGINKKNQEEMNQLVEDLFTARTNRSQVQHSKLPKLNQSQNLNTTRTYKNPKMIIVNNTCLQPKDIYSLKNYFNKLSQKGVKFDDKKFFAAFDDKPHLKGVLPGLFSYFDKKSKGSVDFCSFLQRIYPNLKPSQHHQIQSWINQYEQIINIDEPQKKQIQADKPLYLPINTIQRLKQIFSLFDTQNNGFVTMDDLKQSFKLGFTLQDIEDLFKNKDGSTKQRLTLLEFSSLLFPKKYELHPSDINKYEQELEQSVVQQS